MTTLNIESQLEQLYEQHFGALPLMIKPLKGDGSDRKVFRLYAKNGKNIIGVAGANHAENDAFVTFSRQFYRIGLPVPEIYFYDQEQGLYLEKDLGDTTLCNWLQESTSTPGDNEPIEIYKQVLLRLVEFQLKGRDVIDFSKCYQYPAFLHDAIRYDLNYFANSFVRRFATIQPEADLLEKDFGKLINRLVQADASFFMYRDFQSKNIMLVNGEAFFIDYQSGRKGALQYDLASLLFDANVNLALAWREELLDFYLLTLSRQIKLTARKFKELYYDFVLIRMLQALAAFSFLAFNKGKVDFLRDIPNALYNIKLLLSKDCILSHMPELRRLFEDDIFLREESFFTEVK